MIISQSNINFYLFEKGFLSLSEYYLNRNSFKEFKGKNFALLIDDFYIKQTNNKESDNSIYREASFYSIVNTEFKCIEEYLPRFFLYDHQNRILIIEGLQHTHNLYRTVENRQKKNVLRKIGSILNKIHSINYIENLPIITESPYIFKLKESNIQRLLIKQNPETQKLLNLLLKDNIIFKELETCSQMWQPSVLTHNDTKLSNWLFQNNSKSLFLIDWETCSWGDPLWDWAGVIQSFIITHFFESNVILLLNHLPFHPILDDDDLKSIIKEVTLDIKLTQHDKQKLIRFIGCYLIISLIELSYNSELGIRYSQITTIAKEMMQSPQIYFSLF